MDAQKKTDEHSAHSNLLWTFSDVHMRELDEIKRRRRDHEPDSQTTAASVDSKFTENETDEGKVASKKSPQELADEAELVGLTFSGGGIRSATFNLGVLQALAKMKFLKHMDYISTVSGGGYIGGWFSAWVQREGYDAVEAGLLAHSQVDASNEKPSEPPFAPISFLRDYSNYLTPRLGIFSLDSWTLIAIYLRNLLLNLLTLLPSVLLVLLVPWLLLWLYQLPPVEWRLVTLEILFWILLFFSFCFIANSLFLIDSGPASWSTSGARQDETKSWRYKVSPLIASLLLASLSISYSLSQAPDIHLAIDGSVAQAKELSTKAKMTWKEVASIEDDAKLLKETDLAAAWTEQYEPGSEMSEWILAANEITPERLKSSLANVRESEDQDMPPVSSKNLDVVQQLDRETAKALDAASKLTKELTRGRHVDISPLNAPEADTKTTKNLENAKKLVLETWEHQSQALAKAAKSLQEQEKTAIEQQQVGRERLNQSKLPNWLRIQASSEEWDWIQNRNIERGWRVPATLMLRFVLLFAMLHMVAHLLGYVTQVFMKRQHLKAGDDTQGIAGGVSEKSITNISWPDMVKLLACATASGAAGGAFLAMIYVYVFCSYAAYPGIILSIGPPLIVIAFTLAAYVDIGLSSKLKVVTELSREWWARLCAWLLIYSLGWMALFSIVWYSPFLLELVSWRVSLSALSAWLFTTIASVLAGKSVKSNGGVNTCAGTKGTEGSSSWMNTIAVIGPPIFLIGLLIIGACVIHKLCAGDTLPKSDSRFTGLVPQNVTSPIEVLTTHTKDHPKNVVQTSTIQHQVAIVSLQNLHRQYWENTQHPDYGILLILGIGGAVCLCVFAPFVDVNTFSLHSLYANRLTRCYLGASVRNRIAHPFIGFSREDDIKLKELSKAADRSNDGHKRGPFHIINTALNLVHGRRLAWQERKASSFTLTSVACGSEETGYWPTPHFAGGELTLGRAISISGAAASPNMGNHSSPAVGALMTVFNVRLGWWMPNPKGNSCQRIGPRVGLYYLFNELFGLTDDEKHFVYLSDGGHFENLGAYELIRRRCRYIIICDAGADPDRKFSDLGGLIRKCRVDFNVEIKLTEGYDVQMAVDEKRRSKACFCTGTINYPGGGEPGILLYLKPSVCSGEPADVLNYLAEHDKYPHEPTADQFFSESQFESYRALGSHMAEGVFSLDTPAPQSAEAWFKAIVERGKPPIDKNIGDEILKT